MLGGIVNQLIMAQPQNVINKHIIDTVPDDIYITHPHSNHVAMANGSAVLVYEVTKLKFKLECGSSSPPSSLIYLGNYEKRSGHP